MENKDNPMNFIEAVIYSYETEESIVPDYYSEDAKATIQYYIYDGKLWCQGGTKSVKICGIPADKQECKWVKYKGIIPQWHRGLKARYLKLQEICEPNFSLYEEYKQLKELFE